MEKSLLFLHVIQITDRSPGQALIQDPEGYLHVIKLDSGSGPGMIQLSNEE